jgi:microcystin-dependent protein
MKSQIANPVFMPLVILALGLLAVGLGLLTNRVAELQGIQITNASETQRANDEATLEANRAASQAAASATNATATQAASNTQATLTRSASQTAAAAAQATICVVSVNALSSGTPVAANVRSTPSLNGNIVRTPSGIFGSTLEVYFTNNNWYCVAIIIENNGSQICAAWVSEEAVTDCN